MDAYKDSGHYSILDELQLQEVANHGINRLAIQLAAVLWCAGKDDGLCAGFLLVRRRLGEWSLGSGGDIWNLWNLWNLWDFWDFWSRWHLWHLWNLWNLWHFRHFCDSGSSGGNRDL